jgi:protein-S-isoprenylcysteine O-methyltransferase Ste14
VASIIDTGGYTDAEGVYNPVVGIYDTSPGAPPIIIGAPDLQKPIEVKVVDTYKRTRVTFDANGGTLIGPRVITVVEPQTALPYMPASPIRDGYTFRYWATAPSGGIQFTADTPLVSDVTVYALWTQNPPTPPTPPTPPPTITINNPPPVVGGGNTYVTVEPGTETESTTLGDSSTPLASGDSIPDVIPPLVSGNGVAGWSLLNLLASILSLLLLVVFFIRFFFDRPKEEEYEEEPIDAQLREAMTPEHRAQYQARREADYQTWLADQHKKANRQKALYVNLPVLLIVGAALVEALVILFYTQSFGPVMTIVDDYSVIFILIVFVQLLTPMVAAIIRNNRRANQNSTPAQTATGDTGITL